MIIGPLVECVSISIRLQRHTKHRKNCDIEEHIQCSLPLLLGLLSVSKVLFYFSKKKRKNNFVCYFLRNKIKMLNVGKTLVEYFVDGCTPNIVLFMCLSEDSFYLEGSSFLVT